MTAINVVVQADAAYLLTDGALYDRQGKVRALCSKVLIAETMRFALAPSGRCNSNEIAAALEGAGVETQAQAMAALPNIARRLAATNRAVTDEPDLCLFVVLWSDRTDEPQGWMLSTGPMPHWGDFAPCTWLPIDSMIGTDRPLGDVLNQPDANPATIDMERDGRAIIEHQRRTVFEDGRYYVGGHGELVRVDRSGVRQSILCRWPDQVGAVIRP